MIYRSLFPRDLYAELERLQREFHPGPDMSSSIRGGERGGFPALNVGGSTDSVEIHAFAPGLDPASIEVHLDRGVLSISGERPPVRADAGARAAVHIRERFAGPFRRVISLPDDIDANAVSARYLDGVLYIRVGRRSASRSRRIDIQ